jgi:hypothetical protein
MMKHFLQWETRVFFLAWTLENDMVLGEDDVEMAFLYGILDE